MSDKDDPVMAEAIARAAESRAQILRSKAARNAEYDKMANDAEREATRTARHAAGLPEEVPDPEGTAQHLADSEGNFPANAEVAATGGIGIKASNTNVDTGKPATTPEQAGEAVTESAQKVIGNTPVAGDDLDDLSDEDLRARYEQVLGEKPHHAAGRATMIARIADKQA